MVVLMDDKLVSNDYLDDTHVIAEWNRQIMLDLLYSHQWLCSNIIMCVVFACGAQT